MELLYTHCAGIDVHQNSVSVFVLTPGTVAEAAPSTRTSLTREKTAVVNRLQKTLEDANVKLAAVVTDILGVSGRAMLKEMINGSSDAEALAQLARGRMRKKCAELQLALTGRITPHHRFLLKQHMEHVEYPEKAIASIVVEIERQATPFEALSHAGKAYLASNNWPPGAW